MYARKKCNGGCTRYVEFYTIMYLHLHLTPFLLIWLIASARVEVAKLSSQQNTNEVDTTIETGEKDALITSLKEQIKLLNEQVNTLTKERNELRRKLEAAQIDLIEQERRSKALKEMADKYEKDLEVRVHNSLDEGKE